MRKSSQAVAAAAWIAALAGALPAAAEGPEVRGWVLAPGLPADAPVTVELLPMPSLYEQVLAWLPEREPPAPFAVARPAADGSFRLVAPAPGLYRLVVRAPGRVPMRRDLAPLVEDAELPAVELPVARAVRVQVVDPRGGPVAGATVSVLLGRGEVWRRRRGWQPVRETASTGADGWATAIAAAGEAVTLGAGASGRRAASVEGVDGDEARLVLGEAVERLVEVRRGDRPVPRAAVRVADADRVVVLTDERGRAWLTLPDGEAAEVLVETPAGWRGRHRVRTSAASAEAEAGDGDPSAEPASTAAGPDGGGPTEPEPAPSAPELAADRRAADARPPLVLGVEPPSPYPGRVFAAGSGEPLASALVWAAGDEGSGVTADADGRFTLALVGAAPVSVHAAAPGFESAKVDLEPAAWPRTDEGLALALQAATVIAGEVVDATGQPVTEARVLLRLDRPGVDWDPVSAAVQARRVDERGRFRFANVRSGSMDLRVEAPGRAAVERTLRPPQEGLRLVLGQGGTLRARLIPSGPASFAEARAQLFDETAERLEFEDGERVGGVPVAIAADGGLLAERVVAGEYELAVRVPGHQPLSVAGVAIEDGGVIDLGNLELLPEVVLAGRVVDAEGRGVPAATVEVHPERRWRRGSRGRRHRELVTDAEGRFEVHGLADGSALGLVARAPGYAATSKADVWVPGEEPVVLTLARQAVVFGRVVDAAGAPAEAWLTARREPESQEPRTLHLVWPDANTETGEDGGFELESLPPGRVRLEVYTRDDRRTELTIDALLPGERRGPVIVELPEAIEIAGRVLHRDGRPAAGARVSVRPAGGEFTSWNSTTSDAAGQFRLGGVQPGAAIVTAELGPGRAEREIAAFAGVEVELVLAPSTGVSGRVVGPEGEPAAQAMVYLHREHGTHGRGTEEQGRFAFLDVAAGTYRLTAHAPGAGYAAYPEPIVLREGDHVGDLVLRLSPGASLSGRVLGLSAGELSRLRVAAQPEGPHTFETFEGLVGSGGEFEIRGLPPGRYRLSAKLWETGRGAEVDVELAADERRQGIVLDLSGHRLTVVARVNGQPVADHLRIEGAGVHQRGRRLDPGRFAFDGLKPGTYRVRLFAGEVGPWLDQEVEVIGDQELALDFVGWPVEGWVVDAAGAPVAGASIALGRPDQDPRRGFGYPTNHRTDAAGRFAFPVVPPGSWRLLAFHDGQWANQVIEVPPGGLTGLAVPLEPVPAELLHPTPP